MNVQLKKGTLIQGFKYGYIKDRYNKGKLTINEAIRPCIELIFDLYEQGLGMRGICYKLNHEYNYPTPSEIIEQQLVSEGKKYKKTVKKLWDMGMISRILQDDLYIGILRTHKKELKTIKGKIRKIAKDEQYIFQNHHEPIISKEQFERVNSLLKNRQEATSFYKKGKNTYIFGGFIKCAECGYGGTGVTRVRSRRPDYVPLKLYECSMYRKYGKDRCLSHNIRESYILENFKALLLELKKEYKEILDDMSLEKINKKCRINLNTTEKELKIAKKEYNELIKEKVKQLAVSKETRDFIEETFKEMEQEKLLKIEKLQAMIKKLNNEDNDSKKEKIKKAIDYFDEIIEADIPDKRILNEVLDKVLIYHDKSIEFKLKMNIDRLV